MLKIWNKYLHQQQILALILYTGFKESPIRIPNILCLTLCLCACSATGPVKDGNASIAPQWALYHPETGQSGFARYDKKRGEGDFQKADRQAIHVHELELLLQFAEDQFPCPLDRSRTLYAADTNIFLILDRYEKGEITKDMIVGGTIPLSYKCP